MIHVQGIPKVQKIIRKTSPNTQQGFLSKVHWRHWAAMLHLSGVGVKWRELISQRSGCVSGCFTGMYWQPQIHVCLDWRTRRKPPDGQGENAKTSRCPTNVFIFKLKYTFTCIRKNYIVNVFICSRFRGGAGWQIRWCNVSWQFQSQKVWEFCAFILFTWCPHRFDFSVNLYIWLCEQRLTCEPTILKHLIIKQLHNLLSSFCGK